MCSEKHLKKKVLVLNSNRMLLAEKLLYQSIAYYCLYKMDLENKWENDLFLLIILTVKHNV